MENLNKTSSKSIFIKLAMTEKTKLKRVHMYDIHAQQIRYMKIQFLRGSRINKNIAGRINSEMP
jgi:hypothetical protein